MTVRPVVESVVVSENGIADKNDLKTRINSGEFPLTSFVKISKAATGKYTYSFASKVYSFINEEKFPIIDSFVVTILSQYDYAGKILRTKWGDYSKFIKNYSAFKNAYNLTNKSFKEIDRFIWTYGKILSDYWADMGVLSFDPVPFDKGTIAE